MRPSRWGSALALLLLCAVLTPASPALGQDAPAFAGGSTDVCTGEPGADLLGGCAAHQSGPGWGPEDFDGDGLGDVALFYRYPNDGATVFLARGTAESGLSSPQATSALEQFPSQTWVTTTDVNGDGHADLILTEDSEGSRFQVFTKLGGPDGLGEKLFSYETGADTWLWSRTSIAGGDFDGDGFGDLALLYRYPNARSTVFVARGGADGTLDGDLVTVWGSAEGAWDAALTQIAASDVNGDGAVDLVLAYDHGDASTGMNVILGGPDGLTGAPAESWRTQPGTFLWSASQLSSGDFDGDGFGDIGIFYSYPNDRSAFFVSRGSAAGTLDGSLVRTWNTAEGGWPGPATEARCGVDIDRDGFAESVLARDHGANSFSLNVQAGGSAGPAAPVQSFLLAEGTWAAERSTPVCGGALGGVDLTDGRTEAPDAEGLAIAVAQQRFPSGSSTQGVVGEVVLASAETFADALAGTVLTGTRPLLLTGSTLSAVVADELDRLLGPSGTVLILGGTAAVPGGVEDAVTSGGHAVTRLSGPSRLETALAIADFAGHPDGVLLARAFGDADVPSRAWADAITGGAWSADSGRPIVLSQTEVLSTPTADWYAANAPVATTLLGGDAALSDDVQAAVTGQVRRVAGATRFDTAVQISQRRQVANRVIVFNGTDEDGWRAGLLAAGLAADVNAALLPVTRDEIPGPVADYIAGLGCDAWQVIGSPDAVSQNILDALQGACQA